MSKTIKDIIPDEGWVECPKCGGLGKFRFRWSSPSATNIPAQSDYWDCIECGGRGVIRENLTSEETKNE